ncbi:hypothetical protein ES708_00028 [subsurface metagenome]
MVRLELEITDKMQAKLQERADTHAVEPADIAKMILACELARGEQPHWLDKVTTVVDRVSQIVVAVSKMEAEKSEQK